MTTTDHKKALRESFSHMAGAIQAEDWQSVYDDALEIQHQARCIQLDLWSEGKILSVHSP